MPEKDPLSYATLTYLWVIGLSSWGGIAGYVRKIKIGHCRFSISELVGEVCISAFVGVVTFFLCESAQINSVLAAALIGISGHMGSRAIFIIEKMVEKKAKKWISDNDQSY